EQTRFFFQLLVRFPQLLLLRLQLPSERLRLLQQILGEGVGLERVEHDSDRLRQLFEQRLVGRVEPLEGGELQNPLDLPLEENRENDDVGGCGLTEAGRDRKVALRQPRQEDLLFFLSALPDETFAHLERRRERARRAGIARQQLQDRLAA